MEIIWYAIQTFNQGKHTIIQMLTEGKWNKDIKYAQRMDIDVIDDHSDG